MLEGVKKFLGRTYHPINRVTISKKALIQNYRTLASFNKKIAVAPVLKSNAYGHGICEVARILEPLKPPFLCVDSLFEAYQLYKARIKSQILIMGFIRSENLRVKKLPFSYSLFDLDFAKALDKYQPGAEVHIKIDTGMHRLGTSLEDLPRFIKQVKNLKNLKIVGIMSHLADPQNLTATNSQIENFGKAVSILRASGIDPQWKHIAASGGLLSIDPKKLSKVSNLARVGIALYGINPTKRHISIKPVLKFTSLVAQVRKLKKGEKVGYSGTFIAPRNMTMGVLPAGYFDGIYRRLSNKGVVTVDGQKCPIIGRVSMNITTIDLSNVKNPHVGQVATIYSDNNSDPNTIAKAADPDTIAHEILVNIKPAIRRQII